MPIITDRQGILGDVASTLARLGSLVSSIKRSGSSGISANPAGICRWSNHELEAAPLLNPHAIGTRTLPCLVGGNNGHLILKGPLVATSGVWVIPLELGWARTFSRPCFLQSHALQEDQPIGSAVVGEFDAPHRGRP